jgi:hypothetical protein
MKKVWISAVAMAVIVLGCAAYTARADDDDVTSLRARMNGFNEVPPKLTDATGLFTATVNGDHIDFQLTFSNLTGNPAAAHLHFGQRGVNGGVFLFLCGGGNQPACPAATSGTITGTASAANVVAQNPDQGIPAGDFAAALRAIRSGETYANMHTAKFPGGEIRGQVKVRDDEEHEH